MYFTALESFFTIIFCQSDMLFSGLNKRVISSIYLLENVYSSRKSAFSDLRCVKKWYFDPYMFKYFENGESIVFYEG